MFLAHLLALEKTLQHFPGRGGKRHDASETWVQVLTLLPSVHGILGKSHNPVISAYLMLLRGPCELLEEVPLQGVCSMATKLCDCYGSAKWRVKNRVLPNKQPSRCLGNHGWEISA